MKYTLNEVFDKIYVINLDKRRDRLIEINQKFNRLGIDFERVAAVNGSDKENLAQFEEYLNRPFDHEDTHELERKRQQKTLKGPGAIGILKSYRDVILDAKKLGLKKILIFEDDAIFIKGFNEKFDLFYKNISNLDWKVLGLGATQHVWNFPNCLSYPSGGTVYSEEEPYYYPKVTDGAFSLGIDHSIFDELLEHIEKYNSPLDSGPIREIYTKYNKKCVVAQPNLVIADVSTSDIWNSRNQIELGIKLKWEMEKYDFPFKHDLVSIIIPTYNAGKTLQKSVGSLIHQTYPNIEIIIQDDFSTDNTSDVGKKLAKENTNVFYYRNPENLGCYDTRNNAIRASKGRYIAIQDPDDISLTNRIQLQVLSLIESDALVSIGNILRSKCDIEELDFKDEDKMMALVNSKRVPNENGIYPWLDRKILGFAASLFKREVFVNYGLFWSERFSSDAEIMERILAEKLGLFFPINSMNIHSYLMDLDEIPGIYCQIRDVVYVCSKMDGENLTNKYKGNLRVEFEEKWRKRLRGEYFYEYPRLTIQEIGGGSLYSERRVSEKTDKSLKINLLRLNSENALLNKELLQKENDIKEFEKGFFWYSNTYDHLPKWFLKLGGIFRRIKFKKGF